MNAKHWSNYLLGIQTTPQDKVDIERMDRALKIEELYTDLLEALKNSRRHPGIPLYKVRQALLEVFEPEELDMLTNYEL